MSADIIHSLYDSEVAVNGGKMNQFYLQKGAIQNSIDEADTQYREKQIPDYGAYAKAFGLADHFFASVIGGSCPNHLVLVAGQSLGVIDKPDNALSWGCDAASWTRVPVQMNGQIKLVFPCFDATTLADEADRAGLSWRYYAAPPGRAGYLWSSLDAIRHIRHSSEWTSNISLPEQFVPDVKAGNLPRGRYPRYRQQIVIDRMFDPRSTGHQARLCSRQP